MNDFELSFYDITSVNLTSTSLSNCNNESDYLCAIKWALGSVALANKDHNTEALLASVQQILFNSCPPNQNYSWKMEHDFIVSITLTILAVIGLLGNILSCIVIFAYLRKSWGAFVLSIFLSLSDLLVVIMQTVDAYRSSAAMDFFAVLLGNDLIDPQTGEIRYVNAHISVFWHYSLQLSTWFIMLLSVDRYMTLTRMHASRKRNKVLRQAWILYGIILVTDIAFKTPHLGFTQSWIQKTSFRVTSHFM